MTPEHWERVEDICWSALERPAEERPGFLAAACGDDAVLRADVEHLLGQIETGGDFLARPLAVVTHLPVPEDGAASRRFVGPYRIVRVIGRGGMGEVYLAVHEGEDFHLPVAVKVIKRGMDSDEVLRRFRLERQILASLKHPNIASLIDGGATEDGAPYFVMEFVDGMPIDEYCDRHRLTIRRRIEMFRAVCAAVQHAHQNLVVHRDLKPSNLLVTGEGVPMLLDFGIGKVLAPSVALSPSSPTGTDVRVLTPEYASPEQLRGDPVTTASDVYGLGVLLYLLLTGHHPYADDAASFQDLERAVAEGELQRPSAAVGAGTHRRGSGLDGEHVSADTLAEARQTDVTHWRRTLSGDLDTIILMAMQRDPGRRYPTAVALREDLTRYLEGRPVLARTPSMLYRLGRYVRRHAVGVTAAAAVTSVIIVSAAVTFLQSGRVARERDKAVEVRNFLLESYGAAGANRATGDSVTARQLLDGQATHLDESYGDRPELKAEMLDVLAQGYERLGLLDEAEQLADQALSLRRATLGSDDPDLATSLNTLGWILRGRGERERADSLLTEAVAVARRAGRRHRGVLARALNDFGVVRDDRGDREAAETALTEALALRTATLGADDRSVGITASNLSVVFYKKGDYGEAVTLGERAVHALTASLGTDHQRTLTALGNLAAYRVAMGNLEEAEKVYRTLWQRQERLQGPDHPMTRHHRTSLAITLNQLDRPVEAESVLVDMVPGTAGSDENPQMAQILTALGDSYRRQGRLPEARGMLERAIDIERTSLGEWHQSVGGSLWGLAELYVAEHDPGTAARLLAQAVTVYDSSFGTTHPQTIDVRLRLSQVLVDADRPAEARTVLERALTASGERLSPDHALVRHVRAGLIEVHAMLGDTATADSLLAAFRQDFPAELITPQEEEVLARAEARLTGR